jgi:hypothetical protein
VISPSFVLISEQASTEQVNIEGYRRDDCRKGLQFRLANSYSTSSEWWQSESADRARIPERDLERAGLNAPELDQEHEKETENER